MSTDRNYWRDPFSDDDPELIEKGPAGPPDDPRFEWVEIANMGGDVTWIKGKCHHLTPAPVDLRTGQLVAWWCPDCGDQFDADRWPCPPELWVPLPDVNHPPMPRSQIKDETRDDVEIIAGGHILHRSGRKHPMVGQPMPEDPDYVITWQNPRMDDDGFEIVAWAYWTGRVIRAVAWEFPLWAWNGIKGLADTKTGTVIMICLAYVLMLVVDFVGGVD